MRREFVKRRIAWGAWMVWVMGTTFGLNVEAQDRSQARSMVISRQGIVAAESPLAAQAGVRILEHGGNALEAAIAPDAVRGVGSPIVDGIGGDPFVIVERPKGNKTHGVKRRGL